MNIVKQIMDQLSGDSLGQLSSLLGTDAETTEHAATAAVPSLLAGLAGMMSSDDGAKKLTNVLGGLDANALGNIAQMLGGGNAGSTLSKGTSMLGSLFGDSITSSIAAAVSRFTGLNSGIAKSLLAYLLPFVLGKVAAVWKNQGGTSQALKSLFADQRDNVANAIPAGFSLAEIPGLSEVRNAAYSSNRRTEAEPVASSSPMSWLLPLALALVGGFILWQFVSRPRVDQTATVNPVETVDRVEAMKPVVPDTIALPSLADARNNLSGLFQSLDTTFTDIRDAASAERAMPALRDANSKIDAMNLWLSRLPAATSTAIRPLLDEQVKVAVEKAETASSIPGISSDFRALIQEIVNKLTKWISAGSR